MSTISKSASEMNDLIAKAFRSIKEISGSQVAVKTKWSVVIGAPSSGKTALLESLGKFGIDYKPEPARLYLEEEIRRGRTTHDIWANAASAVMPIHVLRVKLESSLKPDDALSLDTAIPDSLPYALLYRVDYSEIARACMLFKYSRVFFLDTLPLTPDTIRKEDNRERYHIGLLAREVYSALGYELICVPVMPLAERTQFVLNHLRYDE